MSVDYDSNSWATPFWLYNYIAKEFCVVLDACASDKNHKHPCYITKKQNALEINWKTYSKSTGVGDTVWVNPPYGRGELKKWINKAVETAFLDMMTVVMLVPATPDAKWFSDFVSEVRFITGGRISFIHPETNQEIKGNTKGSMFLIFKPWHPTGSSIVTTYVEREYIKLRGSE